MSGVGGGAFSFLKLWVCVQAYMSLCALYACRYPWRLAEGIGSPGTGVIASVSQYVGAGHGTWVLGMSSKCS